MDTPSSPRDGAAEPAELAPTASAVIQILRVTMMRFPPLESPADARKTPSPGRPRAAARGAFKSGNPAALQFDGELAVSPHVTAPSSRLVGRSRQHTANSQFTADRG